MNDTPLPAPSTHRPLEMRWRGTSAAGTLMTDIVVLAVCALVLFWGLGTLPIRDNNEALYAEIARVMASGGSWIVPHLDGVPYIEKPPLLYWTTAIAFKLFGVGTWQARLPSVLAAWLLCMAMVAFGRILGVPRAGRVAALVAGTAFGYTLIARTILFDTLMVAFWMIALGCWFLAIERRDRRWLRVGAASIALATLSKGPEAVLLLGLVVAWQIAFHPNGRRRAELLRFTLDPLAIALFLALTAPWMIAATLQQPGFGWFFFVNETIMRFLGRRIPDDYHTGPWWYYLPKLLAGLAQWTPVLAAVALAPLLARRGSRPADAQTTPSPQLAAVDRTGTIALVSGVLIFVFFSLAQNKGGYYILPVIPLLGWWFGTRIERHAQQRWMATALTVAALTCVAMVLALWLGTDGTALGQQFRHWGLPPGVSQNVLHLFLGLVGLGLAAAALWHRRRIDAGMVALALMAWPMLHFTNRIEFVKSSAISQAGVAASLHDLLPSDTRVYSWQTFEDEDASLLFYGFRPLRVIDSRSADLWFGCAARGGDGPCVDLAQFDAARRRGPVAVWVARDHLAGWLATGAAAGMQRIDFSHCVVFTSGVADKTAPEVASVRPAGGGEAGAAAPP